MKATAFANANIALVKYWGKRDNALILPYNGSISMTCDGLEGKTTVEFSKEYSNDIVIINDEELKKDEKDFLGHLERIRKMAGIKDKAKVVCEINFPVAAGLASSAAGLASGTAAAARAAGLDMDKKDLSILTRICSGSACRSIFEGFVEWKRGKNSDGTDSYAEIIAEKGHWPDFRMIATVVSFKKKPVSSRAGMAQTVATSPYYKGWLDSVNEDLEKIRKGIKEKNFGLVGETAEYNCLKMHATMMTTRPPIIYWLPGTMEIMQWVRSIRESGTPCYFTIDAGPQVKVMCLAKDQKEISKRLLELSGVKKTIVCKPGGGARLTDEHMF